MKIGILTYHKANNLGAVLQAYALQEKINQLKNEKVEIINYDNGFFNEYKKIINIKNIGFNIYYFVKNIGFNKFRNTYLNLSKKYTPLNIHLCNDYYNTIITGSDQVWNLSCSHNDYNYFLEFANKNINKIAYAASLGTYKYNKKEKEKIYKLLKDFKKISIREKNSIKEFTEMNLNIETIVDPVFLLNKNEWLKITPKKLKKEKYIFVYLIQEDVNVMAAANKYALDHNCKIISNKKSIEFIINNNPANFLSWIYYAEAIFTNSFHGTAFSLIFQKKLGADITLKNGEKNNRIMEILNLTKNNDCIINQSNLNGDFVKKNNEIQRLQEAAINFIKSI